MLVRSFWPADVRIDAWEPEFEIEHRRISSPPRKPRVTSATRTMPPTRVHFRALVEAGLAVLCPGSTPASRHPWANNHRGNGVKPTMSDCVARLRGRAMRTPCAVAFALVATATFAAPLATTATADAADGSGPVIRVKNSAWLSPNGDQLEGQGPHRVHPGQEVRGDVKVRRANKARTVVYKEELGKLSSGIQTWTWNGTNLIGKVVRDGGYSAVFVADQVADDGKTRRALAGVYIDTRFDASWAPEVNADTIYPNTTLIHDMVGVGLNNDRDDPMTALGRVVMRVQDAQGRAVLKTRGFEYHSDPYPAVLPILITGRDDYNRPLPAGAYSVLFEVWDMAGERRWLEGCHSARVGQAPGGGIRDDGRPSDGLLERVTTRCRRVSERWRRLAADPVRHRGALRGVRRPGRDELPVHQHLR